MEDCARLIGGAGGDGKEGKEGGVMLQMCAMHKKWLKVYAGEFWFAWCILRVRY